MLDISDEERRSYRGNSTPPIGLRRRRGRKTPLPPLPGLPRLPTGSTGLTPWAKFCRLHGLWIRSLVSLYAPDSHAFSGRPDFVHFCVAHPRGTGSLPVSGRFA